MSGATTFQALLIITISVSRPVLWSVPSTPSNPAPTTNFVGSLHHPQDESAMRKIGLPEGESCTPG
jgi:hypothetical protein